MTEKSLIDALLNIQPGKSILLEYGDIPKDAEKITLPSGMGGTVIERRGNLLAVGMLAGAAVTTVLYIKKDSQMIRIRPIPHQKLQTKTGDIVNAPEYNRWMERMKKEAPEYLPMWEKALKEPSEKLKEATPILKKAFDVWYESGGTLWSEYAGDMLESAIKRTSYVKKYGQADYNEILHDVQELGYKNLKEWYEAISGKKILTENKITVDISSKDYKAGYNTAIQGRIYPPVPAWTDQGIAEFKQGYDDGMKDKTRKENEELLAKEKTERSRLADIEAGDRTAYEYELNQLPHHLHKEINNMNSSILGVGKDDKNYHDRYVIALGKMRDFVRRYAPKQEKKEIPVFGLPQDTKKVIEEFGKLVQAIPEKPKVIGAPSRQERELKALREKSHEGMRLKNQQTLTSAISTSRHLGEFEEKPIIPQQPVKSMADENKAREARQKAESLLLSRLDAIAENTRLKRELDKLKDGE